MSTFQQDSHAKKPQKPVRSTWVVAVISGLILVLFIAAGDGGFGMWLFVMGLLGLLTAAYALVFRRRTWARLGTRKTATGAMAAAGGLAALGLVVFSFTAPPVESKSESAAVATQTPSQTTSASPSASHKATVVAGASCPVAGKVITVTNSSPTPSPTTTSARPSPSASSTTASAPGAALVCTEDDSKKLVWMASEESKKLLADREATEEKAEADRIAAEAEAKRIADEATAAEAQRLADEQAAADAAAVVEAQRLADEQARQQYVAPAPVAPAPVAPVAPAPPVYYKNCTEARNAGAAPVYVGGPGYGTHLDRDGDGIGCEK